MADRGISHSGLTVLYEPPSGGEEPVADIIFVHGIQGHPYRTWRVEKPPAPAQDSGAKRGSRTSSIFGAVLKPFRFKGAKTPETTTASVGEDAVAGEPQNLDVFWPQDLLPEKCPDARILTWGYDSMVAKLSGAVNKVGIFAHANNFMYALGREHKLDRPIIFVAHSLGGVLVKEMLVNAEVSENPSHLNVITSTAAVVFMGTPHRGSQDLAGLGEVVRKVASLMLVDTNPKVLDSLGLRNDDLVRSNRTFIRLWRKHDFRVKTFEEGSGLTRVDLGFLNKKVVPEISSTLGDPREEAETLLGNHMDICRISSKKDPKFPIVAGELRSICQRLGKRPLALLHGLHSQDDIEQQIQMEQAIRVYIQSLSFVHMYHREHGINEPEEGTCTWLLQHSGFQNWLGNDEDPEDFGYRLLWVKGKPGSGKSYVMKTTMRSLQSKERLIARFFFDRKSEIELNRSSSGLFRSIIHQLVSHDEGIRQKFLAMDSHQASAWNDGSAIEWTLQDLKSTLRTLIMSNQANTSQIFIFIDAIDECEWTESRDILMYFRDLVEKAHSSQVFLRVCVSSRPFLHISVSNCLEITVDQLNHGDILAYISRQLSMADKPDNGDWRMVKDTISQKARGVFLWAVLTTNLALDYHDQGDSMETIHRRLIVVPPQLADLYAEILGDLRYDCFITYRFFQWVILSTTSLRLREWYQILPWIHQQESPARFSDLRESEGFTKSDDTLEQKIRTISRGLVEVVRAPIQWGHHDEVNSEAELHSVLGEAGSLDLEMGETRGVRVIHESVRHFFLYQYGFAVLLKSCHRIKTSRLSWTRGIPSQDAYKDDILIHGHHYLMKMCFEYQQLAELDALVDARNAVALWLREPKGQPKSPGKSIKKKKIMKKKEKTPRGRSRSRKPAISPRLSSRSSSGTRSILSFASAGSSIDTDHETVSHIPSRVFEALRYRNSQGPNNKKELHSIILPRYLEESHAEDSILKGSPLSDRSMTAAAPVVFDKLSKTTEQQPFLSLQHYSTTQLFVHAKLAEQLGAEPHDMISLFEPRWTRIMLLQENYHLPDMLEYCTDIDLHSWVIVLLERSGSYSTRGAVFDAFCRAFYQNSRDTMSAIVAEDFKRADWAKPGWSILDHIIRLDRLDLVFAWIDIVSKGLRLKSISADKLEQLIEEHHVCLPSDYDDYDDYFPDELQQETGGLATGEPESSEPNWLKRNSIGPAEKPQQHKNMLRAIGKKDQSAAAVLERELGNFLGYLPSLRQRRPYIDSPWSSKRVGRNG